MMRQANTTSSSIMTLMMRATRLRAWFRVIVNRYPRPMFVSYENDACWLVKAYIEAKPTWDGYTYARVNSLDDDWKWNKHVFYEFVVGWTVPKMETIMNVLWFVYIRFQLRGNECRFNFVITYILVKQKKGTSICYYEKTAMMNVFLERRRLQNFLKNKQS